ncbi:unnamed protein product [Ceutorhynchus assimilis]|uniref:Tudor domain-containing protein n=1 Tax=Ceutorhynchus assimilis TaxID=467358 RepID=A0A9N9MEW2_9CUCU|nr:unnamed protein product [Ceutorhynchus assimilis]
MIKEHISKFPCIESHYSRNKTQKKYLGSHLNISKMYELFFEECRNQIPREEIPKKWLYADIFNTEFNLSFKEPNNDTCDACDEFIIKLKENLPNETRIDTQNEYDAHLSDADNRYQLKKQDKEASKNVRNCNVLTVDLQKCLPTPLLKNAQSFYSLKLWTFNYTVYNTTKKTSSCFVWDESIAGRGGNEMASCLLRYILTLDESVENIIIWSDNCPSQNRNLQMLMSYFYVMMVKPSLKSVEHKYLLRGHTHMEVDSVHARIERQMKASPDFSIITPWDWQQLMRLCNSNLMVEEMQTVDFKNFNYLYDNIKSSFQNDKKTTTVMQDNRRLGKLYTYPSWLANPGPIFVGRQVRRSKYEQLGEEAELIQKQIYTITLIELKKTFSEFGNITKLYLNSDGNYANLYFDQPESVTEACAQYNGVNGWTVFSGSRRPKKSNPYDEFNSSTSSVSHTNSEAMEETVYYKGDLVDIQGQLVSYLKTEDGEIFVRLEDIEKAGFKLFQKKYYDVTRIPDMDVLKEIEAKIFHYGMECLLEANRIFTEEAIINMYERVRSKLFNGESKPADHPAQNRRISLQATNSPLSSRTNTPPSAGQRERRSTSVTRTGSNNYHNGEISATREKSSNIFTKVEQPELSSSFEQKCATRVKPSNIFTKDEQPELSSSFEQKCATRVKPPSTFAKVDRPEQGIEVWLSVIRESGLPGSALVQLLDYGNREEIKGNIRQMSEEMQKVPAQAFRFTITQPNSTIEVSKLEIDQDIEVEVLKHFDSYGTTYLVDIKRIIGSDEEVKTTPIENQPKENVKPAPAAKCFMQIAKPTVEIVPGEMVFIVNHTNDKLIVKNKEMASLTKKIITHVASMEKKPVANPKVGQYVLCTCFDHGDGLFRAIIKKIIGELASLQLIDFSIEETLPLTSLRNIDEDLASLPPAQIEINYLPLKKLTDDGLTLLSSFIRNKSKIKSTEVNGLIDFTVDGELLSMKITPQLRQPKSEISSPSHKEPTVVEPVKAAPVGKNKENVKTFFRDMPFDEPKDGVNLYFCYSYHGASLTVIDTSSKHVELIEMVSVEKPGDNEPYEPAQFEMCLAKYDDGTWCRAMATGDNDEKVEVKFVDYGNIEKVNRADIRKLPENMKSIPIFGINAQIEGFEITDAVEKQLKELIPDGELLEINMKVGKKTQNRMNYSVELPSIHRILKEEGLAI